MFDNHRKAIQLSGTPYVTMEVSRGYSDGESIELVDMDLTDELLEICIAEGPDTPSILTLNVAVSVTDRTWQDYKDECVEPRYFPCNFDLTDVVKSSTVLISWQSTNLTGLPRADDLGEPVNLYFEIRRRDGTGPRFVAGDLILTESING